MLNDKLSGRKENDWWGVLEKMWVALGEQRACVKAFNDCDLSKNTQASDWAERTTMTVALKGRTQRWFLLLPVKSQSQQRTDANGCEGAWTTKIRPWMSRLKLQPYWVAWITRSTFTTCKNNYVHVEGLFHAEHGETTYRVQLLQILDFGFRFLTRFTLTSL